MSSYRPSALLASAALVLGAALVPTSAFADDTPAPAPTNADVLAALAAAQAPTAAAAQSGWIAQGTGTDAGSAPMALTAIYAVDRGLTSVSSFGTTVEAAHSGTYMTLSTLNAILPGLAGKRALKAIKRPHATWVFTPDTSLDLRDPKGDSSIASLAPDVALAEFVDPAQTTLTGTPEVTEAADHSSKTYTFTGTDLTDGGASIKVTATISQSNVLTALSGTGTDTDGTSSTTLGYAYGPQRVDLPAKSKTVTFEQLMQGSVLAHLSREVKSTAKMVARFATQKAHHRTVTATAIRSLAGRFAKVSNSMLGRKIFTTKAIGGGVRIIGTNPYRHEHATYAVTAAGKKAVAHRG